jgi:small subunit ribosomal protein S6
LFLHTEEELKIHKEVLMRHYETAFLIAPNLPDEEVQTLIDQMASIVTTNKGTMGKIDQWGKKKMAYQIKKFEEAVYVFFHYESGPEIPAELERQFKQKESVIRYLTLKKDLRDNIRNKKKPAPRRAPRRRQEPALAKKPPAPVKEAPAAKPEEAEETPKPAAKSEEKE